MKPPVGTGGWAERTPRILRYGAPFLVALTAYLGWYPTTTGVLTGDEPHYLTVVDSIVRHRTLDLADAYADPNGVRRWTPSLDPHHQAVRPDPEGPLRTSKSIGLPLLLAPLYAVTGSLRVLRLEMLLLTALTAQLTFRLLCKIAHGRRLLVWLAWGAGFLTLPAMGYSNQLLPEFPGALAVCAGLALLTSAENLPRIRLIGGGVAFSTLPWLHVRFGLLGVGLAILGAVLAASKEKTTADRIRSATLVVAPTAASLATFAFYLWVFYGSPNPGSLYAPGATSAASLLHSYQFGLGSLLGPASGLFPYAPVLVLGAVGLFAFGVRLGWTGWSLIALTLVQVFAISSLGFFGYSLPGRFAIVAIPVLCAGCLVALESLSTMRLAYAGLGVISLVLLAQGYANYGMLFDLSYPRLPLVQRSSMIWPTMTTERGLESFTVDSRTRPSPGPQVFDSGLLEIRKGEWQVTVPIKGRVSPAALAAVVRVEEAGSGSVIVEERVGGGELLSKAFSDVTFRFSRQDVSLILIRIESVGSGRVEAGIVSGRLTSDPPGREAVIRRDFPLGVSWVGAITIAGLSLAELERRRRSSRRGDGAVAELHASSRPPPRGGHR